MSVYVINLTQERGLGCGICRINQNADFIAVEFVSYNINQTEDNRLLLVDHQTNEYIDCGLIGKDGTLETSEYIKKRQHFFAACLVGIRGMEHKIMLKGSLIGVNINWRAVQSKLMLRGLGAEALIQAMPKETPPPMSLNVTMPEELGSAPETPSPEIIPEAPPEFIVIDEEPADDTPLPDTQYTPPGIPAANQDQANSASEAEDFGQNDSRTRIDPFPGRWDSKWYRIEYPNNTWHYIVGDIYINGHLRVKACGVPGEQAPNAPAWLDGFTTYLPTRGDVRGYWLMFQDAETAAPVSMPSANNK